MQPDKRLTEIRLPLQIGTSALWSLARTSAFFPGLVIIAAAGWAAWATRDADKVPFVIGIAGLVSGGALVYYAWKHARLALDERPSDVVLGESGLRIEGGARDGLRFAWSDLEPQKCHVADEKDERLVLWRVIVNIPLLAISIAGESAELMIEFTQKIPVQRLYVARRGHSKPILLAEAELEIERRSLQTLLTTIRSSRWYGEPKASKEHEAKHAPSTLTCAKCGAIVPPAAESSVACRFCGDVVAIPEDVRERVRAAMTLASKRESGMARLERLLESQPSAAFAATAMWAAAIPIALAWPLAGYLILHDSFDQTLTMSRSLQIAMLPILLTFGAFLLARGRLTDRFALHAVVVGFGARDPERPGEPYRCRSCQAALPESTNSPVVRCVYCNQANVLGLDLRSDAREASREHKKLEKALAARTRERWLWGLGSVVSLAMLVGAFFVVRDSLHPRSRAVAAPRFADVYLAATVTSIDTRAIEGYPPKDVTDWEVGVTTTTTEGHTCRVSARAAGFTYDHSGKCEFVKNAPVRYTDARPTPDDGDPRMELDLVKKTATLSDTAPDGSTKWRVTLRVD